MDEKKTPQGLYFSALPELSEVYAYLIQEENANLSTIQPLGCRELLFTDPRILMSPSIEDGAQAIIVCKETTLNCNKFTSLLTKLHFKVIKKVTLTNELFQYCLTFTLTQKLAPLWNKAGKYFIQGRDFLGTATKLNAVSMDIVITDRLCIGLKAYNIKMHPSKVEHFCSSANILQALMSRSNDQICNESIQDNLCYVLPSLKKARVVGITNNIISDSPFKSYEELRKHWKLLYGYRLPLNENLFYNVRFFGTKVFTYPSSCIHSNYPQVLLRCDQQAIFQAFLQDVQNRIPFLCESPLRLTSSALYLSNELHSALSSNQSSLTFSQPQYKHCTQLAHSQQNINFKPIKNTATSQNNYESNSRNTVNGVSNTSTLKPSGARIIPCFTKTILQKPNVSQPQTKGNTISKVFPVFKPAPKAVTSRCLSRPPLKASPVNSRGLSRPPLKASPVNKDLSRTSATVNQDEVLQNNKDKPANQCIVRKLPDNRPGLSLSRVSHSSGANEYVVPQTLTDSSIPMKKPLLPGTYIPNIPKHPLHIQMDQKSGHDSLPTSTDIVHQITGKYGGKPGSPVTVFKRQNVSLNDSASPVKKPRPKPKIQEDVDVKQLALNNQLKKVNAATLVNWLRQHNVAVKQKDKKSELMEKVMVAIKSND